MVQGETASTQLPISGLVESEPVLFRVCAGSNDVFETIGRTVSATPLAAVSELRVASVGQHSATLRWSEVYGADTYHIVCLEDQSKKPAVVTKVRHFCIGV